MTLKYVYILLIAFVATCRVVAQNEDIPIENDNQFPPDNPSDDLKDEIQGSGDGTLDEPPAAVDVQTTTTSEPQLEEVQPPVSLLSNTVVSEDQYCPTPCVCHFEGGADNFVVDCAGYDLTVFPSPIDPKTTTLNLQNNKLTEIPKDVSLLKNLKVLNVGNNSIMDLALGSVSELPELTVLKLGNNRLIYYPQDLKNSFSLSKLEELDLGGNDMRSELKAEIFSNFVSLRKLTLANSDENILQDLCKTLKSTLETVCTESCNKQYYECSDTPTPIDDDLIDATYPGMIPFEEGNENTDPALQTAVVDETFGTDKPAINEKSIISSDTTDEPTLEKENANSSGSGRAREEIAPEQTVAKTLNNIIEAPGDSTKSEAEVKVGAATTNSDNGGVSKSVIGIIVASMIVIVAVIAIKKNWRSIRKRFSSSPRPAERGGANANGTTPEEVPLQDKDKSPV